MNSPYQGSFHIVGRGQVTEAEFAGYIRERGGVLYAGPRPTKITADGDRVISEEMP